MKRLLIIAGSMGSGGAETFLMKVYRTINREQYQFDFLLFSTNNNMHLPEIERLGGKVYYATPKSVNLKRFKRELSDIIRDNHYEYVFRYSENSLSAIDLKIAKKSGAKRCIMRSSNAQVYGGFKQRIIHRLYRPFSGKYIDVKIAPSKEAAAHLFGNKAVKKGEVTIINNGIAFEDYKFSTAKREQLREQLGLTGRKVLGNISRLSYQKNHPFLLDILHQLVKDDPNYCLLLAGYKEEALVAPFEAKIKELGLENNVIHLGIRKDVPDLLMAIDCYVFPSFFEGMPNTVIEGQATGLKCFISDQISPDAKIGEQVTFLPLNDLNRWVREISDYFKTTDIVSDRLANTLKIDANYDINRVADKFIKIVFGE